MSSTDFCEGHVSSIDFLCLSQFFCVQTQDLFQTQKIYGAHMSSAEILVQFTDSDQK